MLGAETEPAITVISGASPGVVLLLRYQIAQGRTVYNRMPRYQDVMTPEQIHIFRTQRRIRGDSDEEIGIKLSDRMNLFSGRDGWILRATGARAEGRADTTAKRLLAAVQLIPQTKRTWLSPNLPKTDPYRTPQAYGLNFLPWIEHDCVGTLIREGSKTGLRWGTYEQQRYFDQESHQELVIKPLPMLQRAAASPEGCEIVPPRSGLTLLEAGRILGLLTRTSAIDMGSTALYNTYLVRLKASPKSAADIHAAYHRVLMHRFLRRTRLSPTIDTDRNRSLELERRACLLQAHRLFVFDRFGCPVSLNDSLIRAYELDLRALQKRSVTQPRYVKDSWSVWLYNFVLRKTPDACAKAREREYEVPSEEAEMRIRRFDIDGAVAGLIAAGL